jgi:hypothetical protein
MPSREYKGVLLYVKLCTLALSNSLFFNSAGSQREGGRGIKMDRKGAHCQRTIEKC